MHGIPEYTYPQMWGYYLQIEKIPAKAGTFSSLKTIQD
jgi:hypothetical protein